MGVAPGACLAALALIWRLRPCRPARAGARPRSQISSPGNRRRARPRERARPAAGCGLPLVATGRVKGVIDGRTLMLNDGREVRLAAIEVAPLIAAAADGEERDRAGRAAQRALAELALGRDVALRQAEESTIATGASSPSASSRRTISHRRKDSRRSLQHELVAQGHARLAARIESQACLGDLRARERDARRAALGLWADPHYSAQPADKPADITARRGRFTVVEGDVVSVRESRGTTYINFGRRWSESFTAVILKRNAGALLAAGSTQSGCRGAAWMCVDLSNCGAGLASRSCVPSKSPSSRDDEAGGGQNMAPIQRIEDAPDAPPASPSGWSSSPCAHRAASRLLIADQY